ncbi:hypothetical protein [Streptacidiphilus rugosus]|uniref:hypothetical protein n=1 Tax=Streptacidiphilus rugosus TaxID=405783 RepID=UPI0012F80DCC|nr:hypothetical protein [Streptacidiphilus rugosus]
MVTAETWYDHPAWGFVGVVIGVVAIVAGIWAAFRAATPKMRLRYKLSGLTPLIAQVSGVDLTVTRNGRNLTHPYVATITLAAEGRQDIPEDAFSKERPLVLDLGAEILDILDAQYSIEHAPAPALCLKGEQLLIGPDLIHRNSVLSISVLVDGSDPKLLPPSKTLVDVRIEEGATPIRQFRQELSILISCLALQLFLVFYGVEYQHIDMWSLTISTPAEWFGAIVSGILGAIAGVTFARVQARRRR